jgi:hypothetical protein
LREYPVYVDGRTDLYNDELLTEWLNIVQAKPGWQQKLNERNVNLVLLEPSWQLSSVLPYEGWALLYEDKDAVVYGRR